MASNTTKKQAEAKATDSGAEKPKRKQLTDAERVAKLEADLAAAREKAAAKSQKLVNTKLAERNKLDEKIKDLQDKRDALTKELIDNGYTGDTAPAEVEQPDDES